MSFCGENKILHDILGGCVTNKTIKCPNNALTLYCQNKTGTYKVPTDLNCSSYIECPESNKLLIRHIICPGDTKFDPYVGKCVKNYDCPDKDDLKSLAQYCPQEFDGNIPDPVNPDP